jgi:hypothetical protein
MTLDQKHRFECEGRDPSSNCRGDSKNSGYAEPSGVLKALVEIPQQHYGREHLAWIPQAADRRRVEIDHRQLGQ